MKPRIRRAAYIKAILRTKSKDIYVPSQFPQRSTDKQIESVCRAHLDMELPEWVDAAVDLMYYNKNDYNTHNRRIFIKKEQK